METKSYSTIVIVSQCGFIIFSTIAMLFYPGGGPFVGDADSYVFSLNFFSDLGLINPSGIKANPFSPQIFAVSLACFSFGQMCFYAFLVEVGPLRPLLFMLLKVAPLISAVCLILVGLSPNDLAPSYHFVFVSIWLLGLFVSISTILFDHTKNRRFAMTLLSAAAVGAIALFSVQSIINFEQTNALRPLSQKILVYILVAWFIWSSRQNKLIF